MLFGFDQNRNGVLDPAEETAAMTAGSSESSADASAESDIPELGWAVYLTIYSKEKNVQADGSPKININGTDMATSQPDLETAVGADLATFIVAYRYLANAQQQGAGGGAGANGGGQGGPGGGQGVAVKEADAMAVEVVTAAVAMVADLAVADLAAEEDETVVDPVGLEEVAALVAVAGLAVGLALAAGDLEAVLVLVALAVAGLVVGLGLVAEAVPVVVVEEALEEVAGADRPLFGKHFR